MGHPFAGLGPAALAGALAVTLVAGCGSKSDGPAFTTQKDLAISSASQSCLVHQKHDPTSAYEGGTGGNTVDVLTFLAYYTANGNKKFCDGKKASSKDKKWAQLYVKLDTQAAAKNVAGILGS